MKWRNYIFDPLNWADMLSALGLPLRASIGFVPRTAFQSGSVGRRFMSEVMVAPRSPVDDFMQHLLPLESIRVERQLLPSCLKQNASSVNFSVNSICSPARLRQVRGGYFAIRDSLGVHEAAKCQVSRDSQCQAFKAAGL